MDKVSSLADPRPAKGRLTATKQSLSYSCWSFGLSGQEAGWQDLRLTRGMSAMLLLLKCPSPLPNCFLSPKCSVRPLSFFQVLVRVCPLTSLSLGPHSLWGPKPDMGDLGCWYVPNVGGIQQLSECPRMRHSCVHISVASTRPRGPRGPSAEREAKTEAKFAVESHASRLLKVPKITAKPVLVSLNHFILRPKTHTAASKPGANKFWAHHLACL